MPEAQQDAVTDPAHVFAAYSVGLVYASVCTSLTTDQATAHLNAEHPTGITSRWEVADEPFANGDPNGRPCNDHPETHRHLLFTC